MIILRFLMIHLFLYSLLQADNLQLHYGALADCFQSYEFAVNYEKTNCNAYEYPMQNIGKFLNAYESTAFRHAKDFDIPSINQVLKASKGYWGYDEVFMNAFMEQFGLNEKYLLDNTVFVMFKSDFIIGFFSFVLHEDRSLELDHFFIHPDFIRQGYGKQMWEIGCNVARDLGADEFTLWADPEAESFYVKMGCEKIGVRKSSFLPNRYPPVMRKSLIE